MIPTTILGVLSLLSWTLAFSQDPDWVPTPEYFSITTYDRFPGAEAIYLLDHGYLTANKGDGMVMK